MSKEFCNEWLASLSPAHAEETFKALAALPSDFVLHVLICRLWEHLVAFGTNPVRIFPSSHNFLSNISWYCVCRKPTVVHAIPEMPSITGQVAARVAVSPARADFGSRVDGSRLRRPNGT